MEFGKPGAGVVSPSGNPSFFLISINHPLSTLNPHGPRRFPTSRSIKSRHIIYLPNGNPCSLGVYARAWKSIKEKPGSLYPGFFHLPERGHDIIQRIREGMHDRISLHLPWYRRGRKWEEYGYQKDMMQAASMLNHPRLIIDWLPSSLERRFAHRLRRNLID